MDEDRFEHYETEISTVDAEIRDLAWWVAGRVNRNDHDLWMETTVVGVQGQVQNAIRHSMTIGGVLATVGGKLISPTTWKASVLGHGSADSVAYVEWVEDTCPQVTEAIRSITTTKQQRTDLCAAYCIALHGGLARGHPHQLGQGRSVSKRSRRSRTG